MRIMNFSSSYSFSMSKGFYFPFYGHICDDVFITSIFTIKPVAIVRYDGEWYEWNDIII